MTNFEIVACYVNYIQKHYWSERSACTQTLYANLNDLENTLKNKTVLRNTFMLFPCFTLLQLWDCYSCGRLGLSLCSTFMVSFMI